MSLPAQDLPSTLPVPTAPRPLVVVLGTGGTIAGAAGRSDDHSGYRAGALGPQDLVAAVPPLARHALELEAVAAVDSKDMGPEVWAPLALRLAFHLARDEVSGAVVTHGTDTLEETAWFLQRVLRPRKPVILVAAMRPATALSADGPQNLLDAVRVACVPALAGVHACLAGRVWAAADVTKLHSYRVDAFGALDAAPVAWVIEDRVVMAGRALPGPSESRLGPTLDETHPRPIDLSWLQPERWPWVGVLTGHADARPEAVRAWVAAGVRGLVVAGTGAGTVHEAWQAPLRAAQATGVAIALATRCAGGPVVADPPAGWRVYPGLGAVKARVELALELMQPG